MRTKAAEQSAEELETLVKRVVSEIRQISAGPALPGHARVTINFHADWVTQEQMVIEHLAREGIYRSQFETGTSNGGLTAFPGGDRWLWESRIFGQAYDDAPGAFRPKYGALNHRGWPCGGSPRFGSAHLRLKPHILARTTFCFPDSYLNPVDFGVADRMGLLSKVDKEDALDLLDTYVEAHVHGLIEISSDVEALVLDPSHRGTTVEHLASTLACPVEWHAGFRMPASKIPDCVPYRGPEVAQVAAFLAADGILTPCKIGLAQQAGLAPPMVLKRVWHCLAKFGFRTLDGHHTRPAPRAS